MPAFQVSKSILIKAPAETVHTAIRDFKQWPAWSPWLSSEPDCKLSYSDDGDRYSWEGEIIGAGEMQVVGDDPPRSIKHRLTILKPWKSASDVAFTFEPRDGGTEVTWTMNSSVPFFMFFMKQMMVTWIGMDYERGLTNLKACIETGSAPSKLEFLGKQPVAGFRYVARRTACLISEIGPRMDADLNQLCTWLGESGAEPAGKPFSIYHRWDMKRASTEYSVGVPLTNPPASPPPGLVTGEVPAHQAYLIRHTGPYNSLGSAWSAGFARSRAKLFKQSKKVMPFEIYENDKDEVPENELITTVHFPLR